MKLGSIFALLGLRAPPKRYGSRVEQFDLKDYGGIRFAQWLHPKYAATSFDAAEIDCLRRYVAPGDGVIDVGAHAGDTSVLFAAAVGSTGRVFAVEPNSYVLPVLEENARLNPDIAPITVMPYAAVENDGPLTFDYSDSGFCNGGDLGGIATMKHGHVYRLEVEGRNVLREIERIAPEWLEKIRLIKSFLDPVRPVKRAAISHGHADHARAGHGAVIATAETLAIMAVRYGEEPEQRRRAAVLRRSDRRRHWQVIGAASGSHPPATCSARPRS
jgi:FkbM family methyltransferase